MNAVLLDTGPLVAYLDRSQEYHAWSVQRFGELTGSAWVCEAVLTETCFLLSRMPMAQAAVGHLLARGALVMAPIGSAAQPRIFALMEKYQQIPMSYADACLIWLAENQPGSRVFTLDSDFGIYRLARARAVPLIAPG